jgi:DNA modification methylase
MNSYFCANDFFSPKAQGLLTKFKFDLCLTDPPFNISDKDEVVKTHGKLMSNKEAWGSVFKDKFTPDEYKELIRKFLKQTLELLNDGGSVCCFIDRKWVSNFINIGEQLGYIFKNIVYFCKTNPVPKVRATNFGSAMECAVWLIKPNTGKTPSGNKVSKTKPAIFNNFKPQKGLGTVEFHNTHSSNVFFYAIGWKHTKHPTAKYPGQIKPLIEHLSTPGSYILDPFAGSFNIGLEALKLGRNYIGFEIQPEWLDEAETRLKDLVVQT